MTFIDLPGLDDVQELRLAEEGHYPLIIVGAEEYKKTQTGERVAADYVGTDIVGHNIQLTIVFEGEPELQSFRHWLVLPLETDDDETQKRKLRMLKRNLTLMDIQFENGFDSMSLEGTQFDANVMLESMTDREGQEMTDDSGNPRMQNRLRVPRFQG